MASNATSENQAMLRWPCGSTIHAASSGPVAVPAFPPTWKIDCASPWRPPEAMRATRDDSGWKMEEPVPTIAAASSRMGKVGAIDRVSSPARVKPMPTASEYGLGCLSVYDPTSGCSSEAVN
ncbi:hypothetical protein GALL_483860 [mine drainage metagenome]|uniref:Uncharacterized protein n=1 Tax=mine drainage metagenome TaxID=410659 RepID=A0A1J5PGV1_9ZZZZ